MAALDWRQLPTPHLLQGPLDRARSRRRPIPEICGADHARGLAVDAVPLPPAVVTRGKRAEVRPADCCRA
eukprot:11227003-Lingulodinium_polyedra.AAC.1